jgi:hypothetical protein
VLALEVIDSKSTVRALLCATFAVALAACQLANDLLPRTHTTSTSPDRRYVAFVHQDLNPDPPDDHLYLGRTDERARHLMALAPDMDWCRSIVWSPDSRIVGFLINEQRLAVFDVTSGSLIQVRELVKADGYPGSQEARNVSLTDTGEVTFDRYLRATALFRTRDGRSLEAPVTIFGTHGRPIHQPEQLLGRERLRIPVASTVEVVPAARTR